MVSAEIWCMEMRSVESARENSCGFNTFYHSTWSLLLSIPKLQGGDVLQTHIYHRTELEQKKFAFVYIIYSIFFTKSSFSPSVATISCQELFNTHINHSDLCVMNYIHFIVFQTPGASVCLCFSLEIFHLKRMANLADASSINSPWSLGRPWCLRPSPPTAQEPDERALYYVLMKISRYF